MADELILVKDIPESVLRSAVQDVAAYTIAFLRNGDEGKPHETELQGTGVLVAAGSKRGIVTADHVAQILPRNARIPLFLQRTSQVHSIDHTGVSIVRIARGSDAAMGPDLAVVKLAPHLAGSLAAVKSFHSLDNARSRVRDGQFDIKDGFWLAQGFINERISVGPDRSENGFTKYFYNFSGIGGPDTIDVAGRFDYMEFPVSHEARADSPRSFGGMSGGGIWQLPLRRNGSAIEHLHPVLAGVMFYQHPTTDAICGIKGHGPRSIYEAVYDTLVGEP